MKHQKAADIKKYGKAFGHVCSVLSIVYVFAALCGTDPSVFRGLDGRLCLPVCAAGIALKCTTVWMSAGAWCLWLEFYAKKRCSRKEAFRVYAKANIGKYLPGNVMHYVERNLFAEKLQLSQKQIAAASISEIAGLVLAAFLMGMLFGYRQVREVCFVLLEKIPFLRAVWESLSENRKSGGNVSISSVTLRVAGVCITLAVLILFCYAARHFGSKPFWRTFLTNLVIYAAVLAMLGVILVPVCWCLGQRPNLYQAMRMIAAYSLAWVFGFVVPGAPGGIGVRELVLTLLLAPVIGKDTVAVLGVLHRLLTVAGDFLVYLLRGRQSFL